MLNIKKQKNKHTHMNQHKQMQTNELVTHKQHVHNFVTLFSTSHSFVWFCLCQSFWLLFIFSSIMLLLFGEALNLKLYSKIDFPCFRGHRDGDWLSIDILYTQVSNLRRVFFSFCSLFDLDFIHSDMYHLKCTYLVVSLAVINQNSN